MKLDKKLAVKRYTKALFALALEQNKAFDVFEELKNLWTIFHKIPELGIILTDHRLSTEQREQIFSLLKGKSSKLIENFLNVLFEANMMEIFPTTVDDFEKRLLSKEQKAKGVVTTAIALSKTQREKLEQNVAKKLNLTSVKLVKKIDETIIGGVIIEVNQTIIDGSVKGQLIKVQQLLNTGS
ncbi:MAG: F0F1 ATP synthase subunit delta [Lactobacillales bacterium]|jgi:F-type H+-transporting ATPase subunit delta|nr:F0F1 ATP synthase subunit delta [Lactobacillales bacterium]